MTEPSGVTAEAAAVLRGRHVPLPTDVAWRRDAPPTSASSSVNHIIEFTLSNKSSFQG